MICLKLKSKIYKSINNIVSYMKIKTKGINERPIIQIIFFSALLNLLLEMLSRRSLIEGIGYVISNPLMFLYNMLIILFTLSIPLLFKRKDFILVLFFTIWLGLGIGNFILLGFRTTPLAAIDFQILKSALGIINIYLNSFQISLIILAFLGALTGMFICWNRFPKKQVFYRKNFFTVGVITSLLFLLPTFSSRTEAFSGSFGNLADAYDDFGFAYCFSASLIDRGISKPDDYSKENIDQILSQIGSGITNKPEMAPNIIMVQLESFFNVNDLNNLTFSENPIPNFTQLKANFSSGYLTVPSIGAGTANTEFEVISGMNLDYFGVGEYPYKTILRTSTCESIAYNLAELGYKSHAIHNNSGNFYGRNDIFPNLGFDSFSSIEYMNDATFNPIGWAKDEMLITEIIKALDATDTQDFIYAISVQPHGKYPNTVVDENQQITVMGIQEESKTIAYEYFINQIYETDAFVGKLVSELTNYEDPVVLVLFGDHLPSLSIENEDLKNGNRFQTEYIIWSNFPMEQSNRNLWTYQLSANLMERLGFNNGILTKYHQKNSNESNYQEKLAMLQYDMLYGEMYVYEGLSPHVQKTFQMGVAKIILTDIKQNQEDVYIKGEGFTQWSVAFVDGKERETLYINSTTLIIKDELIESGNSIFIAQIGDNKKILSQTTEWIVE